MSARAPLLLLVLALFALVGCAARRSGPALKSIHFEGNVPPKGLDGWFAPQTDRALRNAISQPDPSWVGLALPRAVEPAWLDEEALVSDGLRIEVWYANHGYFDARFQGWELVQKRTRPGRRVKPVVLVGHVEQGEPSRIGALELTGLERLPGSSDSSPLRNQVRSLVELEAGDIWDRETWQDSVGAIEAMLAERGYAHVQVHSEITARPDERVVDVRLDVDPGVVCRFGEVEIRGLDPKLREQRVRLDVAIEPGRRFSPKAMAQTRARLFGLGVFAVVDVYPDPDALADPTASVIPVRVDLRSGSYREVQAGPAFSYEPGLQTLELTGRYRDDNVGGLLWRFEQSVSAGPGATIAAADDLASLDWVKGIVPVADLAGTLTIPHAVFPNLTFKQDGRVQVALEPGYRYFRPSWSPSLTFAHVVFEQATVELGYRLEYTRFLGAGTDGVVCDPETGQTLTDDYFLSGLEQTVAYDDRNDALSPTRGWYWTIGLAEYGGPLGGNRDILRATGELRRYWSIPRLFGFDPDQWVFAGRLGGGLIVPYLDTQSSDVPVTERLKLGGGTTVRGWGADRLGPLGAPSDCNDPNTTGASVTDALGDFFVDLSQPLATGVIDGGTTGSGTTTSTTTEPLGGDLSLYGNLEVRLGYLYDVGAVAFVDAGRVWATAADFDPRGIQVSVGAGLRYRTSIGPVRFDVARRFGSPTEFASEPQWAVHLGLSEAF